MTELKKVYRVTKELKHILDEKVDPTNREEIINKVNELIEKRSIYIKKVKAPYTDEEKQIGAKIVELNNSIEEKMNLLFDDLKLEMKQIKSQRKSNRSYTNPYENIQLLDGVFMDSKQ